MTRQRRRRAGPANKSAPNREKKLIGWLVSFGLDDAGKYFELRSGRTLISAKNGNDTNTITLAETSVSAPHMALSASSSHKLLIQDIFSRHGTFITRSDEEEETRLNGPTPVEHGDWIRIGQNTRFQVCLIDGTS